MYVLKSTSVDLTVILFLETSYKLFISELFISTISPKFSLASVLCLLRLSFLHNANCTYPLTNFGTSLKTILVGVNESFDKSIKHNADLPKYDRFPENTETESVALAARISLEKREEFSISDNFFDNSTPLSLSLKKPCFILAKEVSFSSPIFW